MSIDSDSVAADTAPAGGSDESDEALDEVEVITPVIVDLGKVARKHVKALKRGEGKLVDEVVDVLDDVIDELGDELADSSLVPIVLIYERKPKSRRRTIELPF
ncbi:MAG TPA: hypothetical protein VMW08_17265 [Acidimicrobiales bacterium]|nr:hypothetical protein [Acidimicrobiales bacterium]